NFEIFKHKSSCLRTKKDSGGLLVGTIIFKDILLRLCSVH
ncbi:unnamed protein product, partial [Allacma fusca]